MSSPIRLVCFDLGRVLIRICDGWREACGAAGVEAPVAELSREQWAGLLELINRIEVGEGGIDESPNNWLQVMRGGTVREASAPGPGPGYR